MILTTPYGDTLAVREACNGHDTELQSNSADGQEVRVCLSREQVEWLRDHLTEVLES